MAQSLAQVLIHIIFATHDRQPWIKDEVRDELHAYIGGILKKFDSPALTIGSVEDHVHILCALSKNYPIKKILEVVKSNSSRWIKTKGAAYQRFRWQNGYGVFSVSASKASAVRDYIANQAEHHRKISFEEEFTRLLEEYGVDYDKRYLWS